MRHSLSLPASFGSNGRLLELMQAIGVGGSKMLRSCCLEATGISCCFLPSDLYKCAPFPFTTHQSSQAFFRLDSRMPLNPLVGGVGSFLVFLQFLFSSGSYVLCMFLKSCRCFLIECQTCVREDRVLFLGFWLDLFYGVI